jgi:hypothetical protein
LIEKEDDYGIIIQIYDSEEIWTKKIMIIQIL